MKKIKLGLGKFPTTFLTMTTAALLLAAVGLPQVAQAIPINGSIGFTGRASYDSGSVGTSTEVVNWVNPQVNGTSGAFISIADGTAVSLTSPWFFNTVVPVNNFWSVGGFTFQLLASSVTSQGGTSPNGYVSVNGNGVLSGNGYTPTAYNWSFTSQDPSVTSAPITWTFSASSAAIAQVPDGGLTIALLGLALLCVGLFKKGSVFSGRGSTFPSAI